MVTGLQQHFGIEVADGSIVFHHENAVGRTGLALQECSGLLSSLCESVTP